MSTSGGADRLLSWHILVAKPKLSWMVSVSFRKLLTAVVVGLDWALKALNQEP